ncbi:hypothetical protein ACTFIV_006797 [Dictyostelium citrinum]
MEEEKNQIIEMHDNNSNGSNKSEEGLNEQEISYLKSLADDNSRTLALVQKINSLEAMNLQLLEEKRINELKRLENEGRFEGERMFFKSKVSTLEIEIMKLVKAEMELKREMSRLEISGGCMTHENQIREQQELIKDLKSELSYSRSEIARVREENEQLRNDKSSKREGTFLDEENNTVIAKVKPQQKNEIRDDISISNAGSGKGKTGRSIGVEEINELRETLKNHGPVKFFEGLENVFQLHEVKTLANKIRLLKMKILNHCEYVNLIDNNMNMEQIQAIVAKNDDSAARHLYYKELVLNAARKITAKGAGILNYISVFEANYKQLHIGLSAHALIEEFIFFLPGEIKEFLRMKLEEERIKKGESEITLTSWIVTTKEFATNKERVLSEDQTRKRTLQITNNNAVANVINNVKINSKFNKAKNNFRVENSVSDQNWTEQNKAAILKLIQDFKPSVVVDNTNLATTTATVNTTTTSTAPSSGRIAGKCFNCNKVGHKTVDCRSEQNLLQQLQINSIDFTSGIHNQKEKYGIRIKVGDIWITALIDTGCSHSVIHPSLVKEMKIKSCKVIVANAIEDSRVNCKKSVECNIHFNSRYDNELQCNFTFYVVENCNHKAILGLDFLGSSEISFEKKILVKRFRDKTTKLKLSFKEKLELKGLLVGIQEKIRITNNKSGSRVVNVDDIKPFLEEDRELFNTRIKDNSIPLGDEIEKIVEKRNRKYDTGSRIEYLIQKL